MDEAAGRLIDMGVLKGFSTEALHDVVVNGKL